MTIHEVARKAGVSPMTVSRVTNGEDNVREATRDLVLRAIRELNYSPNPAARSLAGATGTRIAMIYSNPSTAYLSELLVGALDKASKTAAQLVLEKWDELKPAAERAAARKLAQSVAGRHPAAAAVRVGHHHLGARRRAGIPVIAIATGRFRSNVSCVRIDDFRAASEMTAHLISLGHTRIGFIKGHPNQTASAQRFAGFETTLEAAGITLEPGLRAAGLLLVPLGPRCRRAAARPQARAHRDLREQRRHGGRRDLCGAPARPRCAAGSSVVGFDDTVTATTVWPELTTIRQPIAAMADAALNLLLRKIRHEEGRRARRARRPPVRP